MVMTQQKYAISAKIWQVSEMSWFSKKLRCVCKTCILPNWHAHIRVRISVVLWRHVSCYYFSNQNYLVSAKLPESAKSPGDDSWYMLCQQQCVVISIDDVLWPDADRLLSCLDFDRHLVSVGSGGGAHFDRCAYIIDLTQYWILEYTFSRWSSQQNMLCQQNFTSP